VTITGLNRAWLLKVCFCFSASQNTQPMPRAVQIWLGNRAISRGISNAPFAIFEQSGRGCNPSIPGGAL
jgi:hypothetical protein